MVEQPGSSLMPEYHRFKWMTMKIRVSQLFTSLNILLGIGIVIWDVYRFHL